MINEILNKEELNKAIAAIFIFFCGKPKKRNRLINGEIHANITAK